MDGAKSDEHVTDDVIPSQVMVKVQVRPTTDRSPNPLCDTKISEENYSKGPILE